jgi:hypothetical protein
VVTTFGCTNEALIGGALPYPVSVSLPVYYFKPPATIIALFAVRMTARRCLRHSTFVLVADCIESITYTFATPHLPPCPASQDSL